MAAATAARWRHFNPLAPRGARPAVEATQAAQEAISIHSPLAGRDGLCSRWTSLSLAFQSTRPSRGETLWAKISHCTALSFQSTRPSRGETRCNRGRIGLVNQFQSTRPSRGETIKLQHFCSPFIISIHLPLAGRDHSSWICKRTTTNFQSTRPLRGETGAVFPMLTLYWFFNPLAPCGARHAILSTASARYTGFQSTRPLRGETPGTPCPPLVSCQIFNPLAPCGARHSASSRLALKPVNFQSTRPLRGET